MPEDKKESNEKKEIKAEKPNPDIKPPRFTKIVEGIVSSDKTLNELFDKLLKK